MLSLVVIISAQSSSPADLACIEREATSRALAIQRVCSLDELAWLARGDVSMRLVCDVF